MPELSLAALRGLLPQMSGANFGVAGPQESADMPLTGLDKAVKYALPFSPQPRELPDVGDPLIPSGPQVSPGVGWANRLADRLPGAVMGGLARQVQTPGALMAPNPYPPGSEQADAYEAFKKSTAAEWAPGMAVGMIGSPAAVGGVPGTVGSGIKAYHSSPHDFDRFDLSKIGTGEGAQVYGHGLYFAESPAVSGQGGQYWNQFKGRFGGDELQAANRLRASNFDREHAIETMQRVIETEKAKMQGWSESQRAMSNPQRTVDQYEKQLALLQSGKPVGPRTYEVDINADPAHFLDWDKSLGEQPQAVKDAFARQLEQFGPDARMQAQMMIAGSRHPQGLQGFTQQLPETIPGIKYLDEGSRAIPTKIQWARDALANPRISDVHDKARASLAALEATPVTSNYVVFNDKLIDIMRKYGLAGLAPLAGLGTMAGQQQGQPQQ